MHFTTLLLSLLSINLAVSLPTTHPDSIQVSHTKAKRQIAGWCTLHYIQNQRPRDSSLFVYGPSVNGGKGPILDGFTNYFNGAYSILPGYGDFLVATQNATTNDVTFRRHGTVSGDTWTILGTDQGADLAGHICGVGKWSGTSRSMDCGFECTPFTGPYAT